MVISERVDDMSVDEILPLPGIKPPQPLDRCAIRIGQARISGAVQLLTASGMR